MEKKTIAWITFNAFLDTDLYIVQQLNKMYDIRWYIVKSGNDKIDYQEKLQQMQQEHIRLQVLECGPRLRSPSCILSYLRLLRSIRRDKQIQMLYTSMSGAPYFMPVLSCMFPAKKTIVAIHNVHVPKGGSASGFFRFYNWFTIHHFQNFQTFSKSQCEQLELLAPQKHVFMAPFLLKDFGVSKQPRSNNLITFLNFGNIRQYKRLDVLIEAAQMVYEKTKISFRVIIAGKCDDWQKYQERIRYPQLFDLRIQRVNNEDIPDLFQECDYFVAPYQDIAQSGSTNVAINYEKPIIASRLPAFEEIVEDGVNGFLITPASISSLAQVMERIVLHHDQIYPQLLANLKQTKQMYFVTEKIVNTYKENIDHVIAADAVTKPGSAR